MIDLTGQFDNLPTTPDYLGSLDTGPVVVTGESAQTRDIRMKAVFDWFNGMARGEFARMSLQRQRARKNPRGGRWEQRHHGAHITGRAGYRNHRRQATIEASAAVHHSRISNGADSNAFNWVPFNGQWRRMRPAQ